MNVRLISLTLDAEKNIAYCARVSSPNQENPDIAKLIKYCIDHKHFSIFEQAHMTVEIETSRMISAQILRHRSFTFQEFCVAGSTQITLELPNNVAKGRKAAYARTIEHLYNLQKQNRLPKFARVFDENTRSFVSARLLEVFQTGVKPVFRVTLTNGKQITCTKEHKVLTKKGFVPLEVAIGLQVIKNTATFSPDSEAIACNGVAAYTDSQWLAAAKARAIASKKGLVGIAEEAGVTVHTIRKWLKRHGLQFSKREVASYTPIWNKGKQYSWGKHSEETIIKMKDRARKGSASNLWRGGVTRNERLKIADWCAANRTEFLRQANYVCALCQSSHKLELHHIKTVAERPDLAYEKSNIQVLCHDCHALHHKLSGDRKTWRENSTGNTLTVRWSTVAKVEFLGEQMTYDLEVDHASHNYVGNGIVVHNSQRYAEVQDFESYEARRQDKKNRQNSIDDLSLDVKNEWLRRQEENFERCMQHYSWALSQGIAKECARAVLPMQTETKLYMTGSIRSWIHYLELRCDKDTQKEHRDIAKAIEQIFVKEFPVISEALGWS